MEKIPADRNPQLEWPIPTPTPLPSGYGLYQVYTALLTQAGTAAPTAVILENTLEDGGNIVWARTAQGTYTGTLTGKFLVNKTWIIMNPGSNALGWPANELLAVVKRANNDVITVNTSAGGSNFDNQLGATPIEVRIYY